MRIETWEIIEKFIENQERMLFRSKLVKYVYPYEYDKGCEVDHGNRSDRSDPDLLPNKKWSYKSEITKDFENNLKTSREYQMCKVMSRDIHASGAKAYFSCNSAKSYLEMLNQKGFSRSNDNELFLKSFDHCVFTGIFLDIDYKVDKNKSHQYTMINDLLIKRMGIFLTKLAKIYKTIVKSSFDCCLNHDNGKEEEEEEEKDLEPTINIMSASSNDELKISYHCLVKIGSIVFTDIYDIKKIVMEAVYECLIDFGDTFFCVQLDIKEGGEEEEEEEEEKYEEIDHHDESNNNNNNNITTTTTGNYWLDLGIYADGKSMRCIYNTKKKSPERPLLPVRIVSFEPHLQIDVPTTFTKKDMTLEALIDNMIHIPYLWFIEWTLCQNKNKDKGKNNVNTNAKKKNNQRKNGSIPKMTNSSVDQIYKIEFQPNNDTLEFCTKYGVEIKKPLNAWFEKAISPLIFGYNRINIVNSDLLFSDNLTKLADALELYIHDQLLTIDQSLTKPIYLKNKKIQLIDPIVKKEYKQHHQYTMMTSVTTNYQSFLKNQLLSTNLLIFKSNNHYCNIKGSNHNSNNAYYVVDLLKMVWYQSCHDIECITSKKKKIQYNIPNKFDTLINNYTDDIINVSVLNGLIDNTSSHSNDSNDTIIINTTNITKTNVNNNSNDTDNNDSQKPKTQPNLMNNIDSSGYTFPHSPTKNETHKHELVDDSQFTPSDNIFFDECLQNMIIDNDFNDCLSDLF